MTQRIGNALAIALGVASLAFFAYTCIGSTLAVAENVCLYGFSGCTK